MKLFFMFLNLLIFDFSYYLISFLKIVGHFRRFQILYWFLILHTLLWYFFILIFDPHKTLKCFFDPLKWKRFALLFRVFILFLIILSFILVNILLCFKDYIKLLFFLRIRLLNLMILCAILLFENIVIKIFRVWIFFLFLTLFEFFLVNFGHMRKLLVSFLLDFFL
jgi:hypothetical protein